MSICLSGSSTPLNGRYVRVLKWTFQREGETVIYELGLTGEDSSYELRIDPPWNPVGTATELFDDAMTRFSGTR